MKVSKIQPIISSKIEAGNVQVVAQELSEKIATTAKKTLTSRKLPNSISDTKEVFNSTCEYSEKYIEILEKMPDWIKKIIKS